MGTRRKAGAAYIPDNLSLADPFAHGQSFGKSGKMQVCSCICRIMPYLNLISPSACICSLCNNSIANTHDRGTSGGSIINPGMGPHHPGYRMSSGIGEARRNPCKTQGCLKKRLFKVLPLLAPVLGNLVLDKTICIIIPASVGKDSRMYGTYVKKPVSNVQLLVNHLKGIPFTQTKEVHRPCEDIGQPQCQQRLHSCCRDIVPQGCIYSGLSDPYL
ncbi:hypothetical protein SDC9_79190 [bioreactor metagenome]|uniref:Uncharacterized protein n=1 Tax=bioreactor metagenome TaxID=1076179 RepID=A0A644YVL4_9ZZZZ